jgi:glutaredoxin
MDAGNCSRGFRGAGALFLVAVLGMIIGCDGFDPSALMPATTDLKDASFTDFADAEDLAQEDPASPRDPDMQSIGPGDSQRVYYQFVDDRGRVQFVERLGDVPEAWRDRVGYVEMSQPPPLTPLEARRTWKLSAARTSEILLATATPTVRGRQSSEVVLYSAKWCGYCKKAIAHLDRNGVDYEIRDVDNGAIAQELREKTGRGGVPVLDFSGEILRGYSAEQYDRAIRSIRG